MQVRRADRLPPRWSKLAPDLGTEQPFVAPTGGRPRGDHLNNIVPKGDHLNNIVGNDS
jgi:hypothetical protein